MKIKAVMFCMLIFPQAVTPAIRAEVSVRQYFALALNTGNCAITAHGYGGGLSESDAVIGAVKSCGAGCKHVITFKTVE